MPKNPESFITIDKIYSEAYDTIVSDIPDRYDRKYKTQVRKMLSEYFDTNIKLSKNSSKKMLKSFYERKLRLTSILQSNINDYNDIKKEYIKICKTINTLNEHRMKYRLELLGDVSTVHTILSIEKNDPTYYNYKIWNNYRQIKEVISSKYVSNRRDVKETEFYLKLLKFLTKEVNHILSRYFV